MVIVIFKIELWLVFEFDGVMIFFYLKNGKLQFRPENFDKKLNFLNFLTKNQNVDLLTPLFFWNFDIRFWHKIDLIKISTYTTEILT